MELGLDGKTALVTGGSSGLGYAIAEVLVAEGARVILASRSKAADAAKKLGCDSVKIDMADESSIRDAFAEASKLSPIDIVINNCGGPATGKPSEIALENWDKGYRMLLRSVVLTTQLAAPSMRARKWGRVLTITSTSAREMIPGLPLSSTYRAGLSALAKELAKELGRSGILVNNLLPGPTRTDRLAELAHKSPEFYASMEKESALGRVGEPEEIGRVGAFLVSAANSFITGTDILADGGFTRCI